MKRESFDATEARDRVCEIAKALAVIGVDSTTLARRVVEEGAKELGWVDDLRKCGEAMLASEVQNE